MQLEENKQLIDDLIVGYLKGELDADQTNELVTWLGKGTSNKRYFDAYSEIWVTSKASQPNSKYNYQKGFSNFTKRINEEKQITIRRLPDYVKAFGRAAAVFMIAFSLGGILFYTIGKKNGVPLKQSSYEMIVPKGAKAQFVLADGTLVTLNAGSKLRYNSNYGVTDRIVQLEGEGYFNVAKDKKRPFIVNTSHLNIRAVGTAFDVKAYPEEGTITTTLVEGIVKIEGTDKALKKIDVSLKPKQKLTYTKNSFSLTVNTPGNIKTENTHTSSGITDTKESSPVMVDNDIKTDLYTSWKDDSWVIEREELGKLMVMLERRFNVSFIYKSEAIKKYKVSGTIRKETLEQVLDLLKLTTPLKYEIKDGFVTLEYDKSRSASYSKVMN
jgi:transmembrane sensor